MPPRRRRAVRVGRGDLGDVGDRAAADRDHGRGVRDRFGGGVERVVVDVQRGVVAAQHHAADGALAREPVRELRLDQRLQVRARPLDRCRVDEDNDGAVPRRPGSGELFDHGVGHGADDFRADGDAVEAQRHEPALGSSAASAARSAGRSVGSDSPFRCDESRPDTVDLPPAMSKTPLSSLLVWWRLVTAP